MRVLSVALIEWSSGTERGGARLLGRTTDPDLIAKVQDRLAAECRRELSRFSPPARSVPNNTNDDGEAVSG